MPLTRKRGPSIAPIPSSVNERAPPTYGEIWILRRRVRTRTILDPTLSDGHTEVSRGHRSRFPSASLESRAHRSRQCPCHAAWRAWQRKSGVKSECVESVALSFRKKPCGFAALETGSQRALVEIRVSDKRGEKFSGLIFVSSVVLLIAA